MYTCTKRLCDSVRPFSRLFVPSVDLRLFVFVIVMRRFFLVAKRERTEQLTGSFSFFRFHFLAKISSAENIVEVKVSRRLCEFVSLRACLALCCLAGVVQGDTYLVC